MKNEGRWDGVLAITGWGVVTLSSHTGLACVTPQSRHLKEVVDTWYEAQNRGLTGRYKAWSRQWVGGI